jgi:hypothetical protein
MTEKLKSKGKFTAVLTRNYWVNASICFFAIAIIGLTLPEDPGAKQPLFGSLLATAAVLGFFGFLGAGIVRFIRKHKRSKVISSPERLSKAKRRTLTEPKKPKEKEGISFDATDSDNQIEKLTEKQKVSDRKNEKIRERAEAKKIKEQKAWEQTEERESQKRLREEARQKKLADLTVEREAQKRAREEAKTEKREKAVEDAATERRLYGIVTLEVTLDKTVRLYSKGYVQVYTLRRSTARYEKLKRISAQTSGRSGVLTITTDTGTHVLRTLGKGLDSQKYVDRLLKFESEAQTILNDSGTTRVTVKPPEETHTSKDGFADQLQKLVDLQRSGALTDEEFKAAKARLIHEG